jgi:beta-fructofuranosidase
LAEWEVLPNALETGPQDAPDGGACFTGSVIRSGSQTHIFYTGFSPGHHEGREQMMHAVSNDGFHYTKNGNNPILKLGDSYYGAGEDFRDPFVFWNEEEELYWMLFTAGELHPVNGIRRGVIGLAVSTDLMGWEFRAPLYAPRKYPSLECPDLFQIGEWWYLLFSQFGRTEYRMGRSPNGPWMLPSSPHFDAGDYFFYAAKTFSDGANRFLLGWCGELSGKKDATHAQWGGTLVTPRQIVQKNSGELELKCPEIFMQPFTRMGIVGYNDFKRVVGEWTFSQDEAIALTETGFSSCLVGAPSSDAVARLRISAKHKSGQVGVLLRSSDNHSHGYVVSIDLGAGMISLERSFTVDAFHGPAFDGPRLICSRELPIDSEASMQMIVFLKKDIVEVFVGGVTLTAPLKDIQVGRFGLFACDTTAVFSEVILG